MYVGLIITIRDLRAHGIPCTSKGADPAAGKRHLEMIRETFERMASIALRVERTGRLAATTCKYSETYEPMVSARRGGKKAELTSES